MARNQEAAAAARRQEASVFSTRAGKSYLEHLRAMTLSDRSKRILDELEAEAVAEAREDRK